MNQVCCRRVGLGLLCLMGAVSAFAAGKPLRQAQARPNVIVILADDLGWMDIVSYASRAMNVKPEECFYETPHIDQLAKEGMTFTQAYSAALCSPARAALLTGMYPARYGFLTASGHTTGSYYSRKTTPPEGYHIHDRKKKRPQAKRQRSRVISILPLPMYCRAVSRRTNTTRLRLPKR